MQEDSIFKSAISNLKAETISTLDQMQKDPTLAQLGQYNLIIKALKDTEGLSPALNALARIRSRFFQKRSLLVTFS
jgi:hypothetical protein